METSKVLEFLKDRRNFTVIVFVILDIVLLAIMGFVGIKLSEYNEQIQIKKVEVGELKTQSITIKNNKDILSQEISTYNELLDSLIPDDEAYYRVISALEQLEEKTGVDISSYTINIDATTEEKMSLSVNVSGTKQALQDLLKKYRYASGRLVTNQTASYSFSEDISSLAFSINLFHKSPKNSPSTTAQTIGEDDIILLQDIVKKMQQN